MYISAFGVLSGLWGPAVSNLNCVNNSCCSLCPLRLIMYVFIAPFLQGSCSTIRLTSLTSALDVNGFSKYTVYMGLFDKALQKVQAFAADFKGCAGNRAGDIDAIEFKNDQSYPITLCVNDVRLS